MITIPLSLHSETPLYEQIYMYIKFEIQKGNLAEHTKLPSTRGLASHLSVSRSTIELAYSQLVSEGYIESKEKSGYYVASLNTLLSVPAIQRTQQNPPPKKESRLPYDFSPFSVDLSHFPYQIWRQLSKNCLSFNTDLFLSGDSQGDQPFREAITSYLHHSRGVRCQEEQVVVGAGVDYLLQLLGGLFSKDTIFALENPAYMRAYRIFHGLGFQTRPVEMDLSGMDISQLFQSGADIAYVTPSHQYPLGIVMPVKRRLELLEWAAQKESRYIIEDDHDSEFRYVGKPIPSLQGLVEQEKVIYIGTFSRAIAPSIRVGYMVLPKPLLKEYHEKLFYYSCSVSRIDQAIITKFMEENYFERHLNRMRKVYKSKHDAILQALKQFGSHISIEGENAGLHIVVSMHTKASETDIIENAKKEGIHLYSLSEHYIQKPKEYIPTFLMGFANISEENIQTGIQKLYQLFVTNKWL